MPEAPARDASVARSVAVHVAVFAVSLAWLFAWSRAQLSTPYWWDAGAVYAPGANWLATHGFDLRPGHFPSDLGRGHVQGFYLLVAVVYRLFGAGPVQGNVVVVAFGALTLTLTYSLGARLFSRPAGAVAALLLGVSPLFLSMCWNLLPEIPITALTLLSLHAWARGRLLESALWGVALVLFKETGVPCPLAIGASIGLHALRAGTLRARWREVALAWLPLVPLAGFFVWQRVVEGWWVLPYHAELFGESRDYIRQFTRVTFSIFLADGRAIALVGALVLYAARAARKKPVFEASEPAGAARSELLVAMALVVLANVGFFTKMFFLERYALPAHACVAIGLAGLLVPATEALRAAPLRALPAAAFVLATALVGLSGLHGEDQYVSGETSFAWVRAVSVYQRFYARLDASPQPGVIVAEWPATDAMRSPFLGFVTRRYRVLSRAYAEGRHVDAIVVVDGLGGADALRADARARGLQLRWFEASDGARMELWE